MFLRTQGNSGGGGTQVIEEGTFSAQINWHAEQTGNVTFKKQYSSPPKVLLSNNIEFHAHVSGGSQSTWIRITNVTTTGFSWQSGSNYTSDSRTIQYYTIN